MMTRTKRAMTAATVLLCALCAWQANAAPPAVLEQVPDDAQVSVVVKDLKALSTKLNNTATRMGIPGVPADLLKELENKLGLTKGLDEKGSAALVLVRMGEPKEGEEAAPAGIGPPLVLLVPTTDAKAMLAQYKPEAVEGGMFKVTMPTENDQPGYAATAGNFVALAEQKETLARFLAKKGSLDKKLTPELAKAFEANDIVVYANVPTFRKEGIKAIDDFKGMMGMMMAMGGGGGNAAGQAAASAVLDMYFDGAKQLLTDGEVGLVTGRLDDAGATLGFAGHFAPQSNIGKSIAGVKPLASPALDGLPAGNILAAGVATWQPGSFTGFVEKITDAIAASPTVAADEKLAAKMKRMAEMQKQVMNLLSGGKFAFYEPADLNKGWLKGTVLFDVTDPAKYQALLTQAIKENLTMDLSTVNPGVKSETTMTENALTVKGVSLTKIAMKFSLKDTPDEPAGPADREMVEVTKKVYGPDGAVIYLGVVGKQVLMVFGDEKLATTSVEAVQANSPALSKAPEIATSAKGVVENPIAVFYLPVDRWIDLAKREMGAGAESKPAGAVALGNPPAPMLVSVGAKGSVLTAELHMPMSALIHIADTVKAMSGGPAVEPAPMPPAQ